MNSERFRNGQRGEGKWKTILVLAFFVASGFAAFKIVPVYVAAYEFRDTMRNQAKFAGVDRKSTEAIREELFRKAQALKLPIAREQIQVSVQPGGVGITCRFAVPVDLVVFTRDFQFDYTWTTLNAY